MSGFDPARVHTCFSHSAAINFSARFRDKQRSEGVLKLGSLGAIKIDVSSSFFQVLPMETNHGYKNRSGGSHEIAQYFSPSRKVSVLFAKFAYKVRVFVCSKKFL